MNAKGKALSKRAEDQRAAIMNYKRTVGDKTPPYWKKKQY